MKIVYSWLCEYLENAPAAEELIAKLDRIGLKVEATEKIGPDFTGVIAAKIIAIDAHPNADKLHIVTVERGDGTQKLVCGAQNIAVGQVVPLATLGARLPGGVLKKAKIRGVESEGMLCSCSELGVPGDPSGILMLPPETPLGTDVRTLYPKGELVMEVEILPNQGHVLSHYALARELSIFYGYRLNNIDVIEAGNAGNGNLDVNIHDEDLCRRYTAISMSGCSNAKTPDWMAERLSSIGVNPKGNILVDGSNYVMFELGQPLHCFDADCLKDCRINVRRAVAGEKFTALDKKEYTLHEDNLVIADSEKPAALAGVMGGLGSAVSDSTDNIVIEAACFDSASVRRTSKEVNLKSDSSYRFERGTDPEMTMFAALRFAKLIRDAQPSARITGVMDKYARPYKAQPVQVSTESLNHILGTKVSNETVYSCLKAFQPDLPQGNGEWQFMPPSFRPDLVANCDIAEELARYIGYDAIPSESNMPMIKSVIAPEYAIAAQLRYSFAVLGFNEIYNHGFLSAKEAKVCGKEPEECLQVINPLSSDLQYLRPSLIAGALRVLAFNMNHAREHAHIFEIGTVYHKDGSEEMRCGGLVFGKPHESNWAGKAEGATFFALKGALQSFLARKPGFRFEKPRQAPSYYECGVCLEMKMGKDSLGYMGQVSQSACKAMDVKESNVFYFELSIPVLAAAFKREFWQEVHKMKPVSSFPSSWRDLSFTIDEQHEWAMIEKAFNGVKDLAEVKLIDVFKGKNVPAGQRSLTVRFIFSSMEKTLTDVEISERLKGVLEKLQNKFGAKLRE